MKFKEVADFLGNVFQLLCNLFNITIFLGKVCKKISNETYVFLGLSCKKKTVLLLGGVVTPAANHTINEHFSKTAN